MTPNNYADGPEDVGDGGREAGLHVREAHALDDLSREHRQPDADRRLAKMDRGEGQHARVPQGLQNREGAPGSDRLLLFLHLLVKPALFLVADPFSVAWAIRQVEETEHAEDNSRQRFADEKPLPAGKAPDAVKLEKRRRDRRP